MSQVPFISFFTQMAPLKVRTQIVVRNGGTTRHTRIVRIRRLSSVALCEHSPPRNPPSNGCFWTSTIDRRNFPASSLRDLVSIPKAFCEESGDRHRPGKSEIPTFDRSSFFPRGIQITPKKSFFVVFILGPMVFAVESKRSCVRRLRGDAPTTWNCSSWMERPSRNRWGEAPRFVPTRRTLPKFPLQLGDNARENVSEFRSRASSLRDGSFPT